MDYFEAMKQAYKNGENVSAIIQSVAQLVNEIGELGSKEKRRLLQHLWNAQDEARWIERG